MRKERRIKDFKELYESLTDPDKRDENKRNKELEEIRNEAVSDTGYQ